MSEPASESPTPAFDFSALGRMLDTMNALNTNVMALTQRFDASDARAADFQNNIGQRLDGIQHSVAEVEVRLSATESQVQELSHLSQRVDELQARITSSTASSSTTPTPAIPTPVTANAPHTIPIPDDSMSDDPAPPARRQRLLSPRPEPAPRPQVPPLRHARQPRIHDRDSPPETSVHLALDVGKFTKDLKSFIALLFEQAFEIPLDIGSLELKHSPPSKHCDIIFSSIAQARHFITWVEANSDVHDDHGNPIHIWAKPTASPRQLAVGKILRDGFRFISDKVPPEVAVATNRRNGTLAVRFRGMAFILFRVSLPAQGPPTIIDGDRLPAPFPGITMDDVATAKRLANEFIATLRG